LSIWPTLERVIAVLLPQECLLCAAPSGATPLCTACAHTLPPLPTPSCPVCALPSPGGTTCGACLKSPPAFDATIAVWRYAFPVDRLVQALKFEHRLALAAVFAAAMRTNPPPHGDLLLPLPLAAGRLRERGFNQAAEIARPLARHLRLPLSLDDCRRTRETAAQSSLPWKTRRRNVKNAFECATDLRDRHIIVIDDVMTTGATLDELARTLKQHGATTVTNWVVARALRD